RFLRPERNEEEKGKDNFQSPRVVEASTFAKSSAKWVKRADELKVEKAITVLP
ncbi:unnamed protein product, partial [Citrullus colocynthis]